jgi:hypothetical protein
VGFLDSLENNLKAMESREERDPARARIAAEARAREAAEARAAGPHADQLRNGPFTQALLAHCRTVGHGKRVLVRFAWIGDTLRLEANHRRLDLAPTSEGVRATFLDGDAATATRLIDLGGDPEALAREWLGGL